MVSVSIKIKNKPYENINELLEDVFYRDKNMAPVALEFLKKVYAQSFGIKANRWQAYISELFKCHPLESGDEKALGFISEKYSEHIQKVRGKKPYSILLKKHKDGKISISEEERKLIEKAIKWNQSFSSYYSILKKLKSIGLIERKKGYFVKSDKFSKIMNSMISSIDQLEDKEGTYVSK